MIPRFETPWILAGLPVAIAYLVWAWRRSYLTVAPRQRRAMLVFRSITLTLLLCALARPEVTLSTSSPPEVALVDVSDSVSDEALARVRQALAAHGPVELVTFAGHAKAASAIERHDGGATDLAEALLSAGGARRGGAPRIVLFSDGNETRGDARAAARQIARAGAVIDVAPVSTAGLTDARVTQLRLPDVLRRGEPARLAAQVVSTVAGRARFEVTEDGLRVDARTLELRPGGQTVDVDVVPTRAGFVRYGATVSIEGDRLHGNDGFERVALVAGEPRVLLCAPTPDEGAHLEEALRANEIDVESISPGSMPSTIEGLSSYDLVLLANLAPFELDRLRQAALTSYVRDLGGGLILVSGPNGLRRAPNGEVGPLATALPLEPATPSERQIPPVALVLLIDRSGSMIGEKLSYAKQAALSVIDHLSENAQAGVIAFDAGFEWITPLAPLEDKEAVKQAIGSLGAGGGTRFYPALEDAYYALGAAEATAKHVILLTDGNSTDPTELPPWLAHIHDQHITVSTVAIGHDVDAKMLRAIADAGQGRARTAASAKEVPSIFLEEAKTVERDAVEHGQVQAKVALQARELAGVELDRAPPLRGYVRAKAKPTAEVLIETPRHDPLLARWRYGLGQSVAFASDATGRWATDWLTWSGFGKLWTQLVRGAQRGKARRELALTLADRGDRIGLAVSAIDAQRHFVDDLTLKAIVLDGLEQRHEVLLPQVGPGRYAAEVALPPGSVLARPIGSRAGRPLDGEWATLARPYPRELERVEPDQALLGELARVTGGQMLAPDAGFGAPRATARPVPLAGPLLLAALLAFLVDTGVKRSRFRARGLTAILLLAGSLLAGAAHGGALGPGDRATAQNALATLSTDPFAQAPFQELVRVYEAGPGLAELSRELKRQEAQQPPSTSLPILIGRVELRRGHTDGIRDIKRPLEHAPPALARKIALALDQGGDREGAIRAYQLGLAGAPPVEERGIRLRLGALLLASGKPADARACWEQAEQRAPGDQALRRRIAEALAAAGYYREAIGELEAIEPLLDGEPSAHIDVLRREADFARRKGDSAAAGAKMLDAFAVAARSGQPRLLTELSTAIRSAYAGRARAALMRVARERAARDPSLELLIGDLLADAADKSGAIVEYRAALKARPNDRYALRQLTLLETGDKRLEDLRALSHAEPSDVKLAEELIAAEFDANRREEAATEARALRARFPDNPTVLYDLAQLLSHREMQSEALPAIERAVELDPQRPDFLIALGDCLRGLGRKDEAHRAYRRMLGDKPQTSDYRQLVRVLHERRETAEERAVYKDALAASPKDVTLRRDFAQLLTVAGELEPARAEWQKVQEGAGDPFMRNQAAHALERIERQLLLNR